MLSYLEKYNQLPLATKQRFSSPLLLASIKELEKKYQVVLGALVIRVLVGEISSHNLATTISQEFSLSINQAQSLANELNFRVFSIQANEIVTDYLSQTVLDESAKHLTDLDKKISEVIAKANINFASRELEERFRKILNTYLRGIRDKINTKESLIKEVGLGGLGFDINSAQSILNLAKDEPIVSPVKQPNSWMSGEAVKTPIARDVEYDLVAAIKARQNQEKPAPVSLEPPVPSVVEGPVPLTLPVQSEVEGNAVEPVRQAQGKGNQKNETEEYLKKESEPAVIEGPVPSVVEGEIIKDNRPRTENGKIKMEDIKTNPKIYTPVDELKYMTIRNFRNLSSDPVRATEVIKKKIEVLGQEDYGKKFAGVQGWKASPTNRMYIEAYQEAINAGKSVDNILAKKLKDNPDYLTKEEFEAILGFNREINKLIH